jgi:hypothetical protein
MRLGVVVLFLGVALTAASQPQWKYSKEDDPLHAKVHDRFTLEGTYLTPPSVSTGGTPSIVVVCATGKVEQNYFNVGAVVDHHASPGPNSYPNIVGLEARVDGKAYGIHADNISTDGRAVYFIRGDLKSILWAKQVIVGMNEYMGPQVVMQFGIPSPAAVMEKCGEDPILKLRGKQKLWSK